MWVWPFRRRAPGGFPARLGSGAAGSEPAGWRTLPPVQRALGSAPLTVGVSSFEATLATRRRPALIGTLEHAVSADAPAGIAHGLADAVPRVQRASAGDLALAVRRPGGGRPRPGSMAGASPSAVGDGPPDAPATDAQAAPEEQPASAEAVEGTTPEAEAPVVAAPPPPALATPPPPRPLVTAPPPPLPPLQLTAVQPHPATVQRDPQPPGQPPADQSPPVPADEPGAVGELPVNEPDQGGQPQPASPPSPEPPAAIPGPAQTPPPGAELPLATSGPPRTLPPAAAPGGVQRAVDDPAATAGDPLVLARPSVPTPRPRRLGLGEPLSHRPDGMPPGGPAPPTTPGPASSAAGGPARPSMPDPAAPATTPPAPDVQRASSAPGPVAGQPQEPPEDPDAAGEAGGPEETAGLLASRPPVPHGTPGPPADPAAQRAPATGPTPAPSPPSGPTGLAPPGPGAAPPRPPSPDLEHPTPTPPVAHPLAAPPVPATPTAPPPSAVAPAPAGRPLPGPPSGQDPPLVLRSAGEPAPADTSAPPAAARVPQPAPGLPVPSVPVPAPGPPQDGAAPLLADRPVPLAGVQRAPETVPPGLGAALAGQVGADLTGVAVHRDEQAGQAADRLQARAFTTGGDIHLPSRHGPLEAQPGRALLAHELVHVAQQRLLGPDRPVEQTAAGQALEREAVAVERTVAAHGPAGTGPARPAGLPLAQPPARTPDGPVPGEPGDLEVLDPRSTALATGAARLGPDGSVVFRGPSGTPPALTGDADWNGGASTQRAPAEPAAPEPPAAPGPPAPPAAPPGDLDELAHRLYDRIRARLKAELRVDRERMGHLSDLRH